MNPGEMAGMGEPSNNAGVGGQETEYDQISLNEPEPFNGLSEQKPKKKGRKEKESQYYRLKPPPKGHVQSSHAHALKQNCDLMGLPHTVPLDMGSSNVVSKDAQVNFRRQLDFINSISKPEVLDQDPVYPNEPIEH
jgi:hypothetical protein